MCANRQTVGARDDSLPPRVATRVLILTWEYPPIVEGGLARHVRKLAENLVAAASTSTWSRAAAATWTPRRTATA